MKDETAITLREGLKLYLEKNAAVFTDKDISPEAREFLRCHDVAHVVFGCDTSIVGEGILKIFTIFGTTLGFWKHVTGYSDAGAFSLFRQYSVGHVLKNVLRLFLYMPRAMVRAWRMKRRWPWDAHEQYLDRTINEIRLEFNIRVLPHS